MKMVSAILVISLLNNVSSANAEDKINTIAARNTKDVASYYSRHRWAFLSRYHARRESPEAGRPIVASPVIDSNPAFFHGTGDGSAGEWVRP